MLQRFEEKKEDMNDKNNHDAEICKLSSSDVSFFVHPSVSFSKYSLSQSHKKKSIEMYPQNILEVWASHLFCLINSSFGSSWTLWP